MPDPSSSHRSITTRGVSELGLVRVCVCVCARVLLGVLTARLAELAPAHQEGLDWSSAPLVAEGVFPPRLESSK